MRSNDSWVVRVIETSFGNKGVHSGFEEKRDTCSTEDIFLSKDNGSCSNTKTTPPDGEEPLELFVDDLFELDL
jgi:hypothetical protein